MCTIHLQPVMQNRSYPEAGGVLYDMIEQRLDDNEKIVINLEGVDSLPSMFLNMSIGRFIETHGAALLRQKISFAQISATQAARLKEYVDKMAE